MFVCMDVSIYVCIYVYVYMYVFYICFHIYKCAWVHVYVYKNHPKKFRSYLNFMLKTNIDKNNNFNKKTCLARSNLGP